MSMMLVSLRVAKRHLLLRRTLQIRNSDGNKISESKHQLMEFDMQIAWFFSLIYQHTSSTL